MKMLIITKNFFGKDGELVHQKFLTNIKPTKV